MAMKVLNRRKKTFEIPAVKRKKPQGTHAPTSSVTKKMVMAELDPAKITVRPETRRDGKVLFTAKCLDLLSFGRTEEEARENLAQNWEARREAERTWASDRRAISRSAEREAPKHR